MQRDQFENYIYNELVLANIYAKLATMGQNAQSRDAYLQFANKSNSNAALLNSLYRDEYGVNFNPIVPDTVLQGGYRELLNEVLSIEISSMIDIRAQTYFQSNFQVNETFRKIADNKMTNIIEILAIGMNLNSTEIEKLTKW
jgi:hypothetical protein